MNNAWAFGILFLVVWGLVAWNYYAPFVPILGPTTETEATIVREGWQPGPNGNGAVQRGLLAYRVGDAQMYVWQRLDARKGLVGTGTRMRIQYATNDPHDLRIQAYLDRRPRCTPLRYFTAEDGHRLKLALCDDILALQRSTLRGQGVDSLFLHYERHGDTLKAYPIGQQRTTAPRLFVVADGRRASVTDLASGQVYSR